MSESEHPERLRPNHKVTAEDIRALAGPATPHFALQVRNRIRRLVDDLPAEDPVRRAGEHEIARLEELANHSGEPRGMGPGWGDHELPPPDRQAKSHVEEAKRSA